MTLVDSHCHLDLIDLADFEDRFDRLVETAQVAEVGHLLCVSIELERLPGMRARIAGWSGISTSVGVHPCHEPDPEPDVETLTAWAAEPGVVAIGETGLDYYRVEGDQPARQRERFRRHVRAARRVRKPLIIHTRDARDDTLAILREEGADAVGGVLHCFTESRAMAEAAIELGFLISFSGILTFKKARELQNTARALPLRHLLVETDAPYLAPVPHRGKTNHPAWVRHVAEQLASLKDLPVEAIAEATTQNFFERFSEAPANGSLRRRARQEIHP
jgi:TatD DNase family protein